MYEFKPKKVDRTAPIWFILVALVALLIGANATLYFFPKENTPASPTPTPTETFTIITPSPLPNFSTSTPVKTQTGTPSPTLTSTI